MERPRRPRTRTEAEGYQLREIWHKTTELHAENEKARSELEGKARQNFVAPDTRINLNVGGQIFETTAGILCKDRWSVLAALCDRDEPIIAPDDDGTFFLDRDWWIFRHILNWLRTDALPQDPMVLLEMYNEAMFYRVEGCAGRSRRSPSPTAASRPRGIKVSFYKTLSKILPVATGAKPRCIDALPGNVHGLRMVRAVGAFVDRERALYSIIALLDGVAECAVCLVDSKRVVAMST